MSIDNYIFKYNDDTPWLNKPPLVKNNRGYFNARPSVIVKNIVTGDIAIYRSIKVAAKQLHLRENSIYKHFKQNNKDRPYKNYLFYTLEEFKSKINI